MIYTPVNLYADFTPNLPLRDSGSADRELDGGVTYSTVYFNGRQTAEGRVNIFGTLARHNDGKTHPAILIIPDCVEEPDPRLSARFASLGYDVLTFDYAGGAEGAERRTNYPSDLKFAYYSEDRKYIDFAEEDARHTAWYEWCCVARYAVNYLTEKLGAKKIGVLGIKTGSDLMWHLLSCDDRLTCAVGLFGAGWRAYRGFRKYGPAEEFPLDGERMRFIAGVDAHAFAPYCKCPVALFTSTNSAEYDADRAHDTLRRVNKKVDAFFCLSPRMREAVDENCFRNIMLFYAVYLNGQRIQMAAEPKLDMTLSGETVELKLSTTEVLKAKNVDIYVCEKEIVPARRNWIKLNNVEQEGDSNYRASYSLKNGGEILFAFAVVDYRNGITVSTPITVKKCPKTQVIKTNLLYSNKSDGAGDYCYPVAQKDLLGGAIYYRSSPLEIVKGPMGISGASSSAGLISYKVDESCVDIRSDSIFKVDVYCETAITFAVTLTTSVGSENERRYTAYVPVPRGEVWQNIVLNLRDFKTPDGKIIEEPGEINSIDYSGDGAFVINNVLLI